MTQCRGKTTWFCMPDVADQRHVPVGEWRKELYQHDEELTRLWRKDGWIVWRLVDRPQRRWVTVTTYAVVATLGYAIDCQTCKHRLACLIDPFAKKIYETRS